MIAKIHVEAWRAAYRGIVLDEFLDSLSVDKRESIWRQNLLAGDAAAWVAQESEAIVGWISAAASRDPDAHAHTAEIWAVYVAPECWGRGIGRSLCETAERYLRLDGFIEQKIHQRMMGRQPRLELLLLPVHRSLRIVLVVSRYIEDGLVPFPQKLMEGRVIVELDNIASQDHEVSLQMVRQ